MSENVLDQARSLFFAEAREMCEQIEASLLKLEEDPADRETRVDDHVVPHRCLAEELEGHAPPDAADFDRPLSVAGHLQNPHRHRHTHGDNVLRLGAASEVAEREIPTMPAPVDWASERP